MTGALLFIYSPPKGPKESKGKLSFQAISNFPRPNVPLYLKGAKLEYWSVAGPTSNGLGFMIAATSYAGRMVMTTTADRDMLPDPEYYAECQEESYQEMKDAVDKAR